MNKKKDNSKVSRGYLNNNPGNIRISSDKFQGESTYSRDKSFKQFVSMAYGYRAIFRILMTYYRGYSLKTIREWISRWAPSSENDTEAYIRFVAEYAGISPDQELFLSDKDMFCKIVAAISRMENGRDANMGEIKAGFDLL